MRPSCLASARRGAYLLALSVPLLSAGCARYVRRDYDRPTGERLSVGPDPNRPGKLSGYQGKTPVLDEESFYRIAGDADAIRRYQGYREAANAQRNAWAGVAIAGFVTAPAVPFVTWFVDLGGGWGRGEGQAAAVAVGLALGVGALATGIVGATLANEHKKRALAPAPPLIDDPAALQRAADAYNRRLQEGRPPP